MSIKDETKYFAVKYKLYNSKNSNIKDKLIYLWGLCIEDLKIVAEYISDDLDTSVGCSLFVYLAEYLETVPSDIFAVKVRSVFIKLHDAAVQIRELSNGTL